MIRTVPEVELSTKNIGVNFREDEKVKICVWAPSAQSVLLLQERTGHEISLERDKFGYWEALTELLLDGDRYSFLIDGKIKRADPASVFQPEGVHGFSQLVNLGFDWTDHHWEAPGREAWIMYEIHTGTFSPSGDFAGIIGKLDHLVNLGVNVIELMPIAQFPGSRNWGYDGVFPYAVQNSYGGPKALQALVDACHQKGIAVVLDVVYNHIGPEGNYFNDFGPYFTDKYKTPWGSAINFDDAESDPVRLYFIENVLSWFRDFHIDGLRLDAVHAIKDLGALHILEAIRLYTDKLSYQTGRKYELIVELDLNDPRFITATESGGYGIDAQWVDEFHHALRVTAGGSRNGYYSDFHGVRDLATSYSSAYVYNGNYSEHRKRYFGQSAGNSKGSQFVVFAQNHDQVGNRMLGERNSQLFTFEMQKLMAAAVMVSPFLPMLFMGEEWGETNPFLYFVSHSDPDLVDAVRKGRKAEFAAFHDEGEAPDPNLPATFENSRLQWDLLSDPKHLSVYTYYQRLILLRKSYPALSTLSRDHLLVDVPDPENKTLVLTRWTNEEKLICLLNFSDSPRECQRPSYSNELIRIFDSSGNRWQTSAPENSITLEEKIIVEAASMSIYLINNV